MDLCIPDMDGYEAAQHIRVLEQAQGVDRQTKIIALTANAFKDKHGQMSVSLFDDYLFKPIQQDNLWQKMRQCLGVEFTYQRYSEPSFQGLQRTVCCPKPMTPTELSAALKEMPSQWLDELRQTSRHLNGKEALQLIKAIPREKSDLVVELQTLVEEYQFGEIVKLLNLTKP